MKTVEESTKIGPEGTPEAPVPASWWRAVGRTRLLLLGLPALLLGLHRIDSADIWFHLATGRWIAEARRVPFHDPFAAPDAARPWINTEWLADLCFAWLYRVGGTAALVLLAAGLGVAALVLPLWLAGRSGARTRPEVSRGPANAAAADRLWPYGWALLLSTAIAYERFYARPEMFSIFLVALWAQLLWRGEPRRPRTVVWLVLLQVVWANVHGAFVLGPLLAVLALCGTAIDSFARRPARHSTPTRLGMRIAWPPLLLLACCATPYGPRLLTHVLGAWRALGGQSLRSGVVEWQPTFREPVIGDLVLMAFVASLGWIVTAAAIGRRRLDGFSVLVVVAMTLLAVSARRHLALFAVTAIPLASGWLAAAPRRAPGAVANALRFGLSFAAPALALGFAFDIARGNFSLRFGPPRQLGWGFSRGDHPIGAGQFVARHALRGPLFNNIAAGSFLIWQLHGDPAPFVDGRLLDPENFGRYRDLLGSGTRFDSYAAEHGFRLAVLALQPIPPVGLFRHLYASPLWRLVYLDGEGAVFVRADELATKPQLAPVHLEAPLPERHPGTGDDVPGAPGRWWRACDPGEALTRGVTLLRLGFPQPARSDLTLALLRCTERWDVGLELSSALLQVGQAAEARPLVERALRHEPGNAAAWVNLGLCEAASGDRAAARVSWKRALSVQPPDPRAARLLQELEPAPPGR